MLKLVKITFECINYDDIYTTYDIYKVFSEKDNIEKFIKSKLKKLNEFIDLRTELGKYYQWRLEGIKQINKIDGYNFNIIDKEI
jgi:hypothetical protein